MGRPNSLAKVELKKGPWTREEDQKLLAYIQENGHGSWRSLPAKAGLQRCGKSCRLRWTNYLRPDIKRGKFSPHEEKAIIRLHALLGNRWSAIAAHLPKRTDNEIKNYWNTRLKKRLARMGIDPTTHKPKNNPPGRHAANLSHMAQWETARLEAEARLARESKLRPNLRVLHKFKPRLLPPPQPPLPLYPAAACLDVLKVWQSSNATSSSCFFGSTAGSLDSPTSTLSFSCNNSNNAVLSSSSAAAAVNPVNNNNNYSSSETVSSNGARGKMDSSMQLDDQTDDILLYSNNITYGCDAAGAVDLAAPADFGCSTEWVMEEFDDSRNYWNELLNIVSSPAMELPRF